MGSAGRETQGGVECLQDGIVFGEGDYNSSRQKTKKKIRVATHRVIYSDNIIDWSIRQKARISAHELSGHFPPKETRIAGPGGGPIPLQKLEVEFVKSNGSRENGGRD